MRSMSEESQLVAPTDRPRHEIKGWGVRDENAWSKLFSAIVCSALWNSFATELAFPDQVQSIAILPLGFDGMFLQDCWQSTCSTKLADLPGRERSKIQSSCS
jgi:hypothetical protein